MHPKQEIKSLVGSFKNAFRGIWVAARYERNFRIHICMMLYVIAFSIIGKVGFSAFSKFLICFGLVLSAELFNTAIELLCDEMSKRYDENIRSIKDISAGAVLAVAVFSAIVGLSVFLSPEVFSEIMQTFIKMPYVALVILLSLPLSVLFILRRKKK